MVQDDSAVEDDKYEEKKMSDDVALKKLKERIEGLKKTLKSDPHQKKSRPRLMGKFFNVGADLVAGVFVGVGMGLLSDWMFGISPWGLIFFFILGSVAGFLNVYRTLTHTKKEHPLHA